MHRLTLRISVLLAVPLVAACSQADPPEPSIALEQVERAFSDEEKRAALALSIGDNARIASVEGAYDRALLCSHAIDSVTTQVRATGALSSEQLQVMDQASTIFANRLRRMAEGEGKSANDIASDLRRMAAEDEQPGGNARVAIACLQQLQRPG